MSPFSDGYHAWLAAVKAGDKVVVRHHGMGDDNFVLYAVVKVTKAQIVCRRYPVVEGDVYEIRYNRGGGYEVGNRPSFGARNYIEPYTDAIKEEMSRSRLISSILYLADELSRRDSVRLLSGAMLDTLEFTMSGAVREIEDKKKERGK